MGLMLFVLPGIEIMTRQTYLNVTKMVTEQKRNFIQVESGLHINPCLKLRNHMFRSGSVEDHLWLVQEVGWLLDSQNGGKW